MSVPTIERLTIAEFHARCKAQGVSAPRHVAFVCGMCGTIQSMATLERAGAMPPEVEGAIGFSCVGRWRGSGPPPSAPIEGNRAGCNWTLGGLLRVGYGVVVVDAAGKEHLRFRLATPEAAQALEREVA